jgi:Leucine-rich repeat (LRR) protein
MAGYVGGGYIGAQKITDTELVHLKELTKLKELNISFTKVTDAGLIRPGS